MDRRTDRQTDRRTENTIHRAAWSQLKNYKQKNPKHLGMYVKFQPTNARPSAVTVISTNHFPLPAHHQNQTTNIHVCTTKASVDLFRRLCQVDSMPAYHRVHLSGSSFCLEPQLVFEPVFGLLARVRILVLPEEANLPPFDSKSLPYVSVRSRLSNKGVFYEISLAIGDSLIVGHPLFNQMTSFKMTDEISWILVALRVLRIQSIGPFIQLSHR